MIRTPEHLRELLQKLDDLAAVAGVGFRWKVSGAMLLPEPDLRSAPDTMTANPSVRR